MCKLFKLQSFWQETTGKARRESGANFSEAKSQLLNKDSTEKHESSYYVLKHENTRNEIKKRCNNGLDFISE